MPDTLRNLGVLAGVAVLAVGGTAWYFSTLTHVADRPAAPAAPSAQPPAPAPAPTAASPPVQGVAPAQTAPAPAYTASSAPAAPSPASSEPASPAPDIWPQGVTPTKFAASPHAYTVIRDTAAYLAPNTTAPQLYTVPAGTPVYTVERSADAAWSIAMTQDGKAAYLNTADLGPYDPSRAGPAILSANVSGQASVLDTANLTVGGQHVTLDGIVGEGGSYAANLQRAIDNAGGTLNCALQVQTYRCTMPGGVDLARAALINGVAMPADDASAQYRQDAQSAQNARRGVWR